MDVTSGKIILAGLCALPLTVFAADYSVQIGAFKHYKEGQLTDLEQFGGLHTLATSSGLTRVRVGKFSTHTEALKAQNTIRKKGYADAYIVRGDESATSAMAKSQSNDVSRLTAIEPASGTPRRVIPGNLTAQEKRLGVYLDGQFRIKKGKQFMTLEAFRELSP